MLHKKLYTGILKEYYPDWLNEDVYLPHITVGNFKSDEELANAAADVKDINEEFKTFVNKISIEIIDENEDSIIELEIPLK
jgi:2'-5' RNA ligase